MDLLQTILNAQDGEAVQQLGDRVGLDPNQTMPEMDGFEFIAHVRASKDAGVRSVPAAALTAFARSEDRTKALRSGFQMHLSKPIDPGELVASIATLVKRAGT